MLKLWCAGKLCSADVVRFDFSCLACRMRRRWYGKYQIPNVYLKYVYKHLYHEFVVDVYYDRASSTFQVAENNGRLRVKRFFYVLIDPGRFLMFRYATIKVFDRFIGFFSFYSPWFGSKPWIEFAEFFANYPK
jgi:hypothetical protein